MATSEPARTIETTVSTAPAAIEPASATTTVSETRTANQPGWGRPFCLALMVMMLLTLVVVGGFVLLLVYQVITIPQNLFSAISNPVTITTHSTMVLDGIQDMEQLLTTRYTYSTIITSEREMPGLLATFYGDRLSMVAVGHVTAGIDLSQLTEDSIVTQNGIMTVSLPAPRLQECYLNEQASYVVARDTGVFASPVADLDSEARRYAVSQFAEMAIGNGILLEAQQQGETAIGEFIGLLGMQDVEQIQVVVAPPDPAAPLPESC